MWTINDLPALGNLAGCTVKGRIGCLVCAENTHSQWLKFSRKFAYMGHWRFFPYSHPFRKKKSWFDGNEEKGCKPKIMTGSNVFDALKEYVNDFGKCRKRKRDDGSLLMWKKRSIFFELPYWEVLPSCHNLDVMHIEKNVCESILGTLLDINCKSKDGLNARKDLQDLGIRQELHPEDRGNRTYLPPAPHKLSKSEKQTFCKKLLNLKLPDAYSSNIANCISLDEFKIIGLKSHDCHVLMQQLLIVALRGLLPKGPRNAIFILCTFFNRLCQRVIDREKISILEDEVVETLCILEKFFPPSFFDIMIHLVVHLGREVRLCGPVHYHWMYPFERFSIMVNTRKKAVIYSKAPRKRRSGQKTTTKQNEVSKIIQCSKHDLPPVDSATNVIATQGDLDTPTNHTKRSLTMTDVEDEDNEITPQDDTDLRCTQDQTTYVEDTSSDQQTAAQSVGEHQQIKRTKRDPSQLKNLKQVVAPIEVKFNEMGYSLSVTLSSFLGHLVREFVPYTLADWRRLPDDMKLVFWKDIQQRFKSRLMKKILDAPNEVKRLKLKPGNILNPQQWKKFVKEKTSAESMVKRRFGQQHI